MLSRTVLPLARRNVFASTVRVSALSAQRPRWYAKGKDSAPYTLPESLQGKEPQVKQPKAAKKQTPAEQPESDTQAKSETEASESPVAVSYLSQSPTTNWNNVSF
jgi:import inner membrane translocase subunit TIM50